MITPSCPVILLEMPAYPSQVTGGAAHQHPVWPLAAASGSWLPGCKGMAVHLVCQADAGAGFACQILARQQAVRLVLCATAC